MLGWLIGALNMLKTGAAGTPTRALVTGTGAGTVGGEIMDWMGGANGDEKKRRRRRRALTASDRADIAFIAGLLGPKAGRDFSTIVATRAR